MQAVVLVGRLGSPVKRRPKPLLEVAGRPFIEHYLLNLRRFGFDRFLLIAEQASAGVKEVIGPGTAFARSLNADVKVVVEPQAMGTGGALAYARDHLAQSYLPEPSRYQCPSWYEALYSPMIVAVGPLGPLPRSDNPLQVA